MWPGGRTRYVEPFAGSASLFFDVEPKQAILGDLNSELIQCYRSLRDDAHAVISKLDRFVPSEKDYYRIREIDPKSLISSESAARFLFLNRFCFNGLYRTNLEGKFNVPYGHQRKRERVDLQILRQAAIILRRAQLIEGDFEVTLDQCRNGDFAYIDPPYATNEARTFREYLPHSFSVSDLQRLARNLRSLHKRGVTFVVSYANTEEALDIFGAWRCSKIQVRRNIAGFAGHRRLARELIVTNIRMRSR